MAATVAATVGAATVYMAVVKWGKWGEYGVAVVPPYIVYTPTSAPTPTPLCSVCLMCV